MTSTCWLWVAPTAPRIYAAADTIEQRTGLTVNPVVASTKRWNDDSDTLITQIKSSPIVEIDLRQSANDL